MSPEGPQISVIIPTYNRADVLPETVKAVLDQAADADFELIIVDDGSEIPAAEILDDIVSPVPITILRQSNAGAAAARNHGIRHARAPLILFLNDDAVAQPGLIAAHARFHEEHAGEKVIMLGTFEQPPEELVHPLTKHLETSTDIFSYSLFKAGEVIDCQHLYTCNLSIPKTALEAVGGFDESFKKCDGEDTDLGLKLHLLSWALHYRPEARSIHRHVLTLGDFERRQLHVSKVFIGLFLRHPHLLLRWFRRPHLTLAKTEEVWARYQVTRSMVGFMLAEVSSVDLSVLEQAGEAELVSDIMAVMRKGCDFLNRLWWLHGYADGFRQHGLTGFPDLLRRVAWTDENVEDPRLSVIVATRDRPEKLLHLLELLAFQDLPPECFEVIVVDDGSQIPLFEQIRHEWPYGFRLERLPVSRGPASARNVGIYAARGRWVFFANDDALPEPDCLRLHLEHQLRLTGPFAVIGRFDLPENRKRTSFQHLVDRTNLLFAQPLMTPDINYAGIIFCTGNVSIPRALLLACNGFDESLPFAGGEDSELGFRAERLYGLAIRFDPSVRCGHDHDLDLHGFSVRQYQLGWTTWHLAKKFDDPSLIGGPGAQPQDAAYWRNLRARLARDEKGVFSLYQRLCDDEARERQTPITEAPTSAFEKMVRDIGFYSFASGLLVANAGLRTNEFRDGDPFSCNSAIPWNEGDR